MPIYEYRCENCGAVSDVKHAYKEQVELTCPACGSHDLKRVFSAAGIVFKGSGFYVNDSRPQAKSSSSTSPKPEKAAGDKADAAAAKPDAPAPAAPPKSGGSGDAAA